MCAKSVPVVIYTVRNITNTLFSAVKASDPDLKLLEKMAGVV